jgi:hypothetical protein
MSSFLKGWLVYVDLLLDYSAHSGPLLHSHTCKIRQLFLLSAHTHAEPSNYNSGACRGLLISLLKVGYLFLIRIGGVVIGELQYYGIS